MRRFRIQGSILLSVDSMAFARNGWASLEKPSSSSTSADLMHIVTTLRESKWWDEDPILSRRDAAFSSGSAELIPKCWRSSPRAEYILTYVPSSVSILSAISAADSRSSSEDV
ncbi:MAG: hypothetical protein IKQ60_09880 [Candidatus Methanomethylophilaceae archaeon]|nr:hypothetical protein [Candidatus Methanomethylophilaceae archaeon]